ncbi:hypothetical protein GCM10027360_09030 [Amycolatopsis echigonensis]
MGRGGLSVVKSQARLTALPRLGWLDRSQSARSTTTRTSCADRRRRSRVDRDDAPALGPLDRTGGSRGGSIALVYPDPEGIPHLFTGDSLFPGGIGNTEKDLARFASLLKDVEEKIFGELPDETWFYPGHGGDSTLGAERPKLSEWRERGW